MFTKSDIRIFAWLAITGGTCLLAVSVVMALNLTSPLLGLALLVSGMLALRKLRAHRRRVRKLYNAPG